MKSIIKFTKASKNDLASRVTLRHSQIAHLIPFVPQNMEDIIVTISHNKKRFRILFACNRQNGTTYKTTSWPVDLPIPNTGFPVELNVVGLESLV